MNFTNPLFPRQAFYFKGGGGGAPSTTIASAPPPPTTQSVEVQMAQRDAAKQAAKKRGLNKTVLAGETGGYQVQVPQGSTLLGQAQAQGKKTLLGGS